MSEHTERVLGTAASLFSAFVSGVASRDIKDGRMNRADADRWKAHTVADFETMLREVK